MVKNKKAAMEMSVGTIVTIVLLMTVLILGLILVKTIFKGAVENIEGIDDAVKNEINKLFAEDDLRKIVIFPSSREVVIKKGEDNLGFAFSIRNVGTEAAKFTYEIAATETNCPESLGLDEADGFISLGKSGEVSIAPGTIMENPKFVKFDIPETAPPCRVRYTITMEKEGVLYGSSVDVDLKIKSK